MEATKNQKRSQQIKSNAGIIREVAECHPLVIISLVAPTVLTSVVYFLMYDVSVFSDVDAYAQSGSLFDFYVLCSMSYLISMSAMWLTGVNRVIKFLCIVMFVMVIDNIAMAVDSQSYDEWYLLNAIDSYLQIICGVIIMLVIFTWIITRPH